MRFYSRFVFICNSCFILAVLLRQLEISKRVKGDFNGVIPFQPLESTVVILGYGAIIFNLIFVLLSLFWYITKRIKAVPGWIVLFNLLIFPLQVYYFFYSNI